MARPGKGDRPFTYWDYRAGMFHKDLGMRIDYVLTSRDMTCQRRVRGPRGAEGQAAL